MTFLRRTQARVLLRHATQAPAASRREGSDGVGDGCAHTTGRQANMTSRRVPARMVAVHGTALALTLALCAGCAAKRVSDAGPTRRLTHNVIGDRTSSRSPDSSRIAYQSWIDGNSEVCIVDIDALSSFQVTLTGIRGIRPSWSPNGRSVAYQAWLGGRRTICVVTTQPVPCGPV